MVVNLLSPEKMNTVLKIRGLVIWGEGGEAKAGLTGKGSQRRRPPALRPQPGCVFPPSDYGRTEERQSPGLQLLTGKDQREPRRPLTR